LGRIGRYLGLVATNRPKTSQAPLIRAAYLYIYGVVLVGLILTGRSVLALSDGTVSKQWLVLAGLTLLTGSFSVKIPSIAAKISVSEAFVFAAVLLFGPAAATAIVALDSFVMSLWLRRDKRSPLRSLFNLAAVASSIWVASSTFFWLARATPGNVSELMPLEQHLWQLFALAAIYFLMNSALVATALAFERDANVIVLWTQNFPWFSLNYFAGVSVAALLVSYTRSVDFSAIGIILPLLLVSYLTYRTALGRIDDSKRHLEQVSELYMSTIETLAMAVDAKDQITHGHIRRVQVYAVELAKRLGVRDHNQMKAIETAALLHDMGKLAIPEHILNKPGKLTPAEFEKMKRHADIGADLLSSIKFPYPVVPIVRYHHEHWDGRGYPSGISGADIPLGARILSVVDCFDALNSDRPYRPRLTPEDAFEILRERRGSMYDPLVVDTFILAYPEMADEANRAGQEARSLIPSGFLDVGDTGSNTALQHIRASVSESAALEGLRRELRKVVSAHQAAIEATQCLRKMVPASVHVFYKYDRQSDSLVSDLTFGDQENLLDGLIIRVGERVSGWSAATRRTSLNSDASLDLNAIARSLKPNLRSTITTPVAQDDRLLGALSAYAIRENGFDESHCYAIEQIAGVLAEALIRIESLPASRKVLQIHGPKM
jgi:putative nucleotidyltransferase with HDIG domain